MDKMNDSLSLFETGMMLFQDMTVTCVCETCNETFLDTTLADFRSKSKSWKNALHHFSENPDIKTTDFSKIKQEPDIFLIKSGINFFHNNSHQIIFEFKSQLFSQRINYSDIFREQFLKNQISLELFQNKLNDLIKEGAEI